MNLLFLNKKLSVDFIFGLKLLCLGLIIAVMLHPYIRLERKYWYRGRPEPYMVYESYIALWMPKDFFVGVEEGHPGLIIQSGVVVLFPPKTVSYTAIPQVDYRYIYEESLFALDK